MDRCVIVGASAVLVAGYMRSHITDTDYIICADGGYDTLRSIGMTPHAVIGDGDSSASLRDNMDAGLLNGVTVVSMSCEKDHTDVNAATDYALDLGYTSFLYLCCTGNRFDHTIANVFMLERLADRDASGAIADEKNYVQLHAGGIKIFPELPDFKYFSIIAIDPVISGVTLKGLKYPLNNAQLYRNEPIGVSNEFTGDEAVVEIQHGRALIIYSRN